MMTIIIILRVNCGRKWLVVGGWRSNNREITGRDKITNKSTDTHVPQIFGGELRILLLLLL